MTLSFRNLLISVFLGLLPFAVQAQTGEGAASLSSAPVLAPQTSGFGDPGAAPSPGFGNQASQPGFTRGPADTALAPADARAAGKQAGGSAEEQRQAQQAAESAFAALPRGEHNEFQDFVAQSTGRVLPLYGLNLFTNAPSTFAPVENIPVTPDYVIGPGDQVIIRVWGQIDGEYRLAVDRDGTINIPKVGTISVSGIKMQDLQGFVRNAIARNFRNFELSVSLGQLRSIRIFVVGQARRPGSYTVSSLSTLVTALFASGGPSATGSMRHIQLKRGDKLVSEFDVYDFLAKGDKSKDARLLPGDVIFVPPQGQLVAVSGSVKIPAIYELKDKTSLGDIIDLAGGLTTTAAGQKVLLERIEQRKVRRVDEFALDPAGLARAVKDGDLVSVLPISPKFDNAVTLRGNVAAPLRYPYRDGMRITDLIPEKDALIVADYYTRKNLVTRTDLQATLAAGAGKQENGQTLAPQAESRLMTEIRSGGAEINWDYALVERLNPADLSPMLLPFNLGKAVLDHDPAQNLLLKPGDVVTVFAKNDIGVPLARRTNLIVLEDEFKHPGVYKAEPGETLRQLVVRTGGATPDAYVFGMVLTRESTRIAQQKSLDEAINRLEADLQRSVSNKARSGLETDTAQSLAQQTAAQQSLLTRLRAVKATGRIILKLPTDAQLQDIPDLQLENGDRLRIPSRPATVSVLGSVYSEGSFLYRPDQSIDDYLTQAGGPVRSADEGAIYVLRADGSVISKRQSGWMMSSFDSGRIMPGDAIVVPEDFERTTWTKTLKDYAEIMYRFGLGAAAIKVLKQ